MSDAFDGKKFGSAVVVPFVATNLTTGASNQDLVLGSGLAAAVYIAPRAGSIVAITAACGAITAGTITLKPHLASTEYAITGMPSPILTSANDTNGTYAVATSSGAVRFAAGAALGISAVTTTTLDPTNTIDVDAFLHVMLDA
jgi:hypothetical protein